MGRETMRWWGWGDGIGEFDPIARPYFLPWVQKKIGLDGKTIKPVDRSTIHLPEPNIDVKFLDNLKKVLRADQISCDEDVRLCHSYGKSYRDLLRMRMGIVSSSPDLVVYPENHAHVEAIVRLAKEHNVCLIPFGGGTNIVGCVEPRENGKRSVVTIHMGTMDRLLNIDTKSLTATFEAGILGPAIESKLNALGYSLGHIPDSFEYSSLGGWIATRSAGQQSDAYGKIEHMVIALKMASPAGTLITKPTPACSIGPDLNQVVIGSEGTLGVITEATVKIHAVPSHKEYYGFIFPNFASGVEAIYEMVHSGYKPTMIRLLDESETEMAMYTGHRVSTTKHLMQKFQKLVVSKLMGYHTPCLLLMGFEGDLPKIKTSRTHCFKLCKKNKGISAGASAGRKWRKARFDVPYLRDFSMDNMAMVDVAETATTWSNLLNLYYNVQATLSKSIAKMGLPGFVACHISHSYENGASLYFIYACKMIVGKEFEQYNYIKGLATDAIVKYGGSLSHHHAVGYEHQPWFAEEVGETGLIALHGIKKALDPQNISNPGKLMQTEHPTPSIIDGISINSLNIDWT